MYAGDISCRKSEGPKKPSLLIINDGMKPEKSIILLCVVSLVFISCDLLEQRTEPLNAPDPQELINAEKDFSQMSTERGMKKAFLFYIARDGVLLRPGEDPITGADAIEYLSQVADGGYTITWLPDKAEIAADGNWGFTYGKYHIEVDGDTIRGTYVNVWKKQDGEWRFVLNSGNQGLAN